MLIENDIRCSYYLYEVIILSCIAILVFNSTGKDGISGGGLKFLLPLEHFPLTVYIRSL
jgi:hypothetical protein